LAFTAARVRSRLPHGLRRRDAHTRCGPGENLSDHPEGLVAWEPAQPIPPVGATDWDISIMFRTDPC
jgi:hypothetical protein